MGKEGVTRKGRGRAPDRKADAGGKSRIPPGRIYSDRDREMTVLGPEDRDAEPQVDWRRLGPPLLIGTCGGFLASFIMGGGGLLRHAMTGFLGLLLGGAVLRALGLSLAIRNPIAAQLVTATIGAGAVILLARMLA